MRQTQTNKGDREMKKETNKKEYRNERLAATMFKESYGYSVVFGFHDANTDEFCVSFTQESRTYKTFKGADRAATNWING